MFRAIFESDSRIRDAIKSELEKKGVEVRERLRDGHTVIEIMPREDGLVFSDVEIQAVLNRYYRQPASL